MFKFSLGWFGPFLISDGLASWLVVKRNRQKNVDLRDKSFVRTFHCQVFNVTLRTFGALPNFDALAPTFELNIQGICTAMFIHYLYSFI